MESLAERRILVVGVSSGRGRTTAMTEMYVCQVLSTSYNNSFSGGITECRPLSRVLVTSTATAT